MVLNEEMVQLDETNVTRYISVLSVSLCKTQTLFNILKFRKKRLIQVGFSGISIFIYKIVLSLLVLI